MVVCARILSKGKKMRKIVIVLFLMVTQSVFSRSRDSKIWINGGLGGGKILGVDKDGEGFSFWGGYNQLRNGWVFSIRAAGILGQLFHDASFDTEEDDDLSHAIADISILIGKPFLRTDMWLGTVSIGLSYVGGSIEYSDGSKDEISTIGIPLELQLNFIGLEVIGVGFMLLQI